MRDVRPWTRGARRWPDGARWEWLIGAPGPARRARIGLLTLLAIGLLLRIGIVVAQQPAILSNNDSHVYLGRAAGELFGDVRQPAGYVLFLRGMHVFTDSLGVMMVLQHLLGLAVAVAAYDAARRLGAGRLAALLPVGAIALNLDLVYLEHAPLSEALFVPMIVLSVWTLARARTASSTRARYAWIVAAGLATVALPLTRTIGLVFLPFALAAAALAGQRWRAGVATAALFAVTVGAVLGIYVVAQHEGAGGGYALVRGTGWAAYSDVAPQADCTRFTPPRGTAVLCEATPPSERDATPTYYAFDPTSPAFRLAPEGFPAKDGMFQAFADAARASLPPGPPFPLQHIADAATALLPQGVSDIGFDRLNDPVAAKIRRSAVGFVDVPETSLRAPYQPVVDLQPYLRLTGSMALLALLVIVAALIWGRGRRWAMVLSLLAVCASWTIARDIGRYYVPTYVLLAFTLAWAVSALLERRDEDRRAEPVARP